MQQTDLPFKVMFNFFNYQIGKSNEKRSMENIFIANFLK